MALVYMFSELRLQDGYEFNAKKLEILIGSLAVIRSNDYMTFLHTSFI